MNLRNALPILASLTLAGTALCQDFAVATALEPTQPKKGQDYAWVVNEPLDMVVVLASWRNVTTDVCGCQILADGTMVKYAMALAAGCQVELALPPAVALLLNDSDLYVQAVGLKATHALTIDASIAAKLSVAGDHDDSKDDRKDDRNDVKTWTEDETEQLFAENLEWFYATQLVNDAKASSYSLYAQFTGRNSGYGLKSAGTSVVDGRTQVNLMLKVPGPGEGDLDIVETHQLLIDLGAEGASTDVHVAITDGRRHTAFRFFGSYGPK